MKRFIQLVAAIKSVASLAFTAGLMVITVAAMLFGRDTISVRIIWQVVFLALIFGALQYLLFSENVFRRMGTPGRMALLCISMLVVLALFALIFQWFPVKSLSSWLLFVGVYAAFFAVATVVLRVVFRMGEFKYNELLTAYKSRHDGRLN